LRENEVLSLMCLGFNPQAIAKKLGMAVKTVYSHIENMKIKAHVYSKSSLVDLYHNTRNQNTKSLIFK